MDAYLISGVPGAGKTTTCRALASQLPRSAHIEGDVLSFEFVVSGLAVPFGDGADPEEWHRQMVLRRRNMCLLADSFADAGFTPILDDVVTDQASLDLHLQFLRTRPLHLVVLAPDVAVAASRDANREKNVFEVWRHLDAELRQNLSGIGLWLDTSELTVGEVVDAVLAGRSTSLIA